LSIASDDALVSFSVEEEVTSFFRLKHLMKDHICCEEVLLLNPSSNFYQLNACFPISIPHISFLVFW